MTNRECQTTPEEVKVVAEGMLDAMPASGAEAPDFKEEDVVEAGTKVEIPRNKMKTYQEKTKSAIKKQETSTITHSPISDAETKGMLNEYAEEQPI
jgi:hypothetical protein